MLLDCKKGPTTSESARFDIYGGFVYSFFLRRNFSLRCSIKAQVAIWRRRAGRTKICTRMPTPRKKAKGKEGAEERHATTQQAKGEFAGR